VSKMFETLYRLERGSSPQADAPEASAVRRNDAAADVAARPFAAPVRVETTKAIVAQTVEETGNTGLLTFGKRFLATAVDFGILGLALGLLWSVIRLAGCDLHLGTRDLPLVMMSGILLATFYWFLWVLAQRETPGTSLVYWGRMDAEYPLDRAYLQSRTQSLPAPRAAVAPKALVARETVKSGPVEDLTLALRILANERILDARTYVSIRHVRDRGRYFLGRWATTGAEVNECAVGRAPAGEASIHSEIYQANANVMAVVHWHSAEIAPFGVSTVQMRPVSARAMFLSEGVPVLEFRSVDRQDPETGEKRENEPEGMIAAALGNNPAVLVRGRGAIVVGQSLKAAVARAYHMTINAKSQAQTILLGGTVSYLAPEEATDPESGDAEEREWEIWKQRLPKA
jgi:ribulose-5-phosphate 4-epimerase/fuculose-1-phosphate aldolase